MTVISCLRIQSFYALQSTSARLRLWTMWPTSPSRKSLTSLSLDPTKKVAIALPACQLMQVSSQLTCSWTAASRTTGAVAVTVRLTLCAMVSASGSWLVAVQLLSTSANQVTISCAIASFQRTLPSVTEHISTFGSGVPRTIAVSGLSLVSVLSGPPLATGCSLSTSDGFCSAMRTQIVI